jgi:hypothetical protein
MFIEESVAGPSNYLVINSLMSADEQLKSLLASLQVWFDYQSE